jgi:hypothetical protein
MRQMSLRRFAIATSTVAFATVFSVGWSHQGGISVSVDSAQAAYRVSVYRAYSHNYASYRVDGSLPWYAVRAYYMGGPWCGVGGTSGYGYGTAAGGGWGGSWTCYSGWADYAARNAIGCTPGTIVKAGDGINYLCQ